MLLGKLVAGWFSKHVGGGIAELVPEFDYYGWKSHSNRYFFVYHLSVEMSLPWRVWLVSCDVQYKRPFFNEVWFFRTPS